jgi:hypothetical protein
MDIQLDFDDWRCQVVILRCRAHGANHTTPDKDLKEQAADFEVRTLLKSDEIKMWCQYDFLPSTFLSARRKGRGA